MDVSVTTPLAIPTEAPAPDAARDREVVIEPRRGWIGIDWGELIRYRELLSFLIWRDIKVKYKQAVLGVAWSVILPAISLCIYGGVAAAAGFANDLQATPRPPILMWMFAGLVPWMLLQRAINDGGLSLINNQPLMTKIYLPRLFLPLGALGNAVVDMLINVVLISGLCLYYYFSQGWTPSWQIVFILPLTLLLLIASAGLSFLLSAATVLYRDLRFLIPFFVQFGLWLSAVPYPLTMYDRRDAAGNFLIPHHEFWKYLYAINPLTGIISGFRSALTGEPWQWVHLTSSIVLSFALLVFGLFYFKRVERFFADIA